jgi:hypothetical protein
MKKGREEAGRAIPVIKQGSIPLIKSLLAVG